MKLSKKEILTTAGMMSLIAVTALAGLALAQVSNAPVPDPNFNPVPGVNPVGPNTVGGLVGVFAQIVRWVYIIFFTVAVLLILFAAFTYLTAAGNEEKVKNAKDRLIYAAVAIVVALLAVGFQTIIRNFLVSGGQQ
jgi:protein-S-isoprenylcysteine O-methyltransferase Ste14